VQSGKVKRTRVRAKGETKTARWNGAKEENKERDRMKRESGGEMKRKKEREIRKVQIKEQSMRRKEDRQSECSEGRRRGGRKEDGAGRAGDSGTKREWPPKSPRPAHALPCPQPMWCGVLPTPVQ